MSLSIGRAASTRAAAKRAQAATKCRAPCGLPAEGAALAVGRMRSAQALRARLQALAEQGAAAAAAGAVAKPGWTLAQQRAPSDGTMERRGWQREGRWARACRAGALCAPAMLAHQRSDD
jgi:hypothetical protein